MPPAPSGLRSWVISLAHRPHLPRHSCSRRYTTEAVKLPPLPPKDEWRSHFASLATAIRERVSIRNPDTAARIANSFLADKSIAAGEGKIIIEAFPGMSSNALLVPQPHSPKTGPGALSRALLELPKNRVQKLIILEDWDKYLDYLKVEHFCFGKELDSDDIAIASGS